MRAPTPANHLLAALPPRAYRRLATALQTVELTYGEILYEPAERIRYVYFPCDCLVSLLTAVGPNLTLEVGMVGNEGIVGTPLGLGVESSNVRALVQGSGKAMRMTSKRFLAEFAKSMPLQRAFLRYTNFLIVQVSQTAGCNRFHPLEARLARWLLMSADRLHKTEFRLTQEFLAHMLGVRRPGVTSAASALEKKKIIHYSRGNITILNRKRLESAACSCYRIVKRQEDKGAQIRNARR